MKFKQFINQNNKLNEAAGSASKETRLQECLHCVSFGIRQDKKVISQNLIF